MDNIENEKTGMGDLSDGRTLIPMGELGAEDTADSEELQDSDHVVVLKKPIKIAGKEYKHLEFDFDELTAKDLHQASKYLKNLGIPVSVPALDFEYQLTLFVRAVKLKMPDVEFADLMRLSAADASKATGLVRDFLLDKDPGLKDLGSDE
ncbi:MAG TPA: hypothetical protein VHR42_08840 [Clostridia bacterium]|nr:hypothetical protein [Clostridia bacterium]